MGSPHGALVEALHTLHERVEGRRDRVRKAGPVQDRVWVLWAVPGEDAHHYTFRRPSLAGELEQPRHSRRRGWFAEDALLAGEQTLGVEYLLVCDTLYEAAGLAHGGKGALLARRGTYADRTGHRLRVLEVVASHERRGALGLKTEHLRGGVGVPRLPPLLEALPVGGNIARVPHRDCQGVRRVAQSFANLECRRLLALDAVGVHRVNEGDGPEFVRRSPGELQSRVEVALYLDDLRAVGENLDGFAQRDLAHRDYDEAAYAGAGRVGRRCGCGVASRGAHTGAGSRGYGPA